MRQLRILSGFSGRMPLKVQIRHPARAAILFHYHRYRSRQPALPWKTAGRDDRFFPGPPGQRPAQVSSSPALRNRQHCLSPLSAVPLVPCLPTALYNSSNSCPQRQPPMRVLRHSPHRLRPRQSLRLRRYSVRVPQLLNLRVLQPISQLQVQCSQSHLLRPVPVLLARHLHHPKRS